MKEAPLLMGIQWVSTDTNLCLVWDYLYVQTRGRYLYTHAQGKDETIMNQQEETLIDTLTNEDNPLSFVLMNQLWVYKKPTAWSEDMKRYVWINEYRFELEWIVPLLVNMKRSLSLNMCVVDPQLYMCTCIVPTIW